MTNTQTPYCTAPWNGLTVREDGTVRTCCVTNTVIGDLHKQSIYEIEKSEILNEIKTALDQGRAHSNCDYCVNEEKRLGYANLRQHYLRYYPETTHGLKTQYLDIRWNNKCNLACMYCNPRFSSSWEERFDLAPRISAMPDYQDQLLEYVLSRSHEVKEITLIGGEPMLMKQNYMLFWRLSQQCQISIVTNMSYDLDRLPCFEDLLQRPKEKIIWNLSMENVGPQFEYVRSNANWDQTKKSLATVVKHWPTTVSLNMVYSMFNALRLTEIIQSFADLGVNKFNLLPLSLNAEMDLANMPDPIRQKAKQQLDALQNWHDEFYGADRDLYPIFGLTEFQKSLSNPCPYPISLAVVVKKIAWYDSFNQVKFCDLWPQEYDLMQKYLA